MDESYQAYLNRVARLILPAAYQSQWDNIQHSPKFARDVAGTSQPVKFPGYTVITPPGKADAGNSELYQQLEACQTQLVEMLSPQLLVPIPSDSFHLTLADLVWDSAYRDLTKANPEWEAQLQEAIAQSFDRYRQLKPPTTPHKWEILGFMLMPRAIAVCLVPETVETYQQVLELRRCIYQNSSLMGLGIEQQYRLTAHITLGYFDLAGDRAPQVPPLSDLNQELLDPLPLFSLSQVQLCKFDDMTSYYRQSDWATLEF
ncbi:DUF1868 domain-containing protein [Merismopedia glauca]|uniref:DUF1868 domain-containing protein n=1 Tax=Merismopedia glauca CCAP 1448/3 TaxID=1296344 RepID=A0A2T1C0I0_9CYAN|nr:DUF1868 domain-containing protein [Merismopedia glauca]PSB01770.1 DUF1868 domain-containing protein [Merismopedia glauca CCAP 1448/3]